MTSEPKRPYRPGSGAAGWHVMQRQMWTFGGPSLCMCGVRWPCPKDGMAFEEGVRSARCQPYCVMEFGPESCDAFDVPCIDAKGQP